jgi:hypothetical protein
VKILSPCFEPVIGEGAGTECVVFDNFKKEKSSTVYPKIEEEIRRVRRPK